MTDLICDHQRLILAVTVLLGTTLFVVAWWCRRRALWCFVMAAFGVASLFMSWRLVGMYRLYGVDCKLQGRVGINVSAFSIWTVQDGVRHQLGDFRGKPVLLYLWGTFCGPCRPSLPVLAELALALQDRAAVVLLSTEDRETLLRFFEKQAIPRIVAYSPEPAIPPGSAWTFPKAPRPTLFIIDRNGIVQKIRIGSEAGSYLRQLAKDPQRLR